MRSKTPIVQCTDVPADLVLLAQNCLVKDPALRVSLVSWSDFEPRLPAASTAVDARVRMERRLAARQLGASDATADAEQVDRAFQRTLSEVQDVVERIVRHECIANPLFPPLEARRKLTDRIAEIRIGFAPKTSLGLFSHSVVWVKIALLDQPAKVIELQCAAGLTSDPAGADSDVGPHLVTAFRGVFQEAAITGILRDALFGVIDRAQQVFGSPQATEKVKGTHWISDVVIPWKASS